MIYARIWTTTVDYVDYTSIRNVQMDGQSINGVSFWSYEGGGASFEVIKDGYIDNIMIMAAVKGVVPVYIQIYRDLEVLADGYPPIDGFELTGQGKDSAGNSIDVIRITINDVLGCVIHVLKDKKYLMPANPTGLINVATRLNTLINMANVAPSPFIWPVHLNNQWVSPDNFPYLYENIHLFTLDYLSEPLIPYPFLASELAYTLEYIVIKPGTEGPEFWAVKWRSYYKLRYAPFSVLPAYMEVLHYKKGKLQGGNITWLTEESETYLHIVDGITPYILYHLLIINSLESDAETIANYQDYNETGQHWWVDGITLMFTGDGAITQYAVVTLKEIEVMELIGILLNMTFSSVYSSGHGLVRKNKTIVGEVTPTAITRYAKFTSNTVEYEDEYKPDVEWMRDGIAVVLAINNYYHTVLQTSRFEFSFECTDAVTLNQMISIREYVGQVNELNRDKNTGVRMVKAVGYR